MSNRSVTYSLYLNENVRTHLQSIEKSALGVDNVMYKLQNTLRAFGIYAAGLQLFRFGKDIVNTTAEFETLNNVIKFSSSSTSEFSKNKQFLAKTIKDLKLPIVETTEAYAKLSAAMIGTKLEGQGTRDLFEGVSIASRVMHLNEMQTSRAFLALEQMVSKGKVMSEELRRQLGNAMPGALRLFAESQGMDQGKLMEKMKQGLIISEEALPKFGKYLKEFFSKGIESAIQSIQANQVDLSNAWLMTKDAIGQELRPEIIELLSTLMEAVHWIKENKTELISWGRTIVDIGKIWLAYKIIIFGIKAISASYLLVLRAFGVSTAIATTATTRQTAAYAAQATAINAVTAAIERLNFVQNASNASFIAGSGGIMANTAANRYAMSAGTAAAAAGVGGAVAGSKAKSFQAGAIGLVTKVFVIGMAAEIMQQLGWFGRKGSGENKSILDAFGFTKYGKSDESVFKGAGHGALDWIPILGPIIGELKNTTQEKKIENEKLNQIVNFGKFYGYQFNQVGELISLTREALNERLRKSSTGLAGAALDPSFRNEDYIGSESDSRGKKSKKDLELPKASSIRGNTVTTINIDVGSINGMTNPQFTVKNMQDMENIKQVIGKEVVKILTDTVNDSQLIPNR